MSAYGQCLSIWSVDERKRSTEVEYMSKCAAKIRDMYAHILGVMDSKDNSTAADLWTIYSLSQYFELKFPF